MPDPSTPDLSTPLARGEFFLCSYLTDWRDDEGPILTTSIAEAHAYHVANPKDHCIRVRLAPSSPGARERTGWDEWDEEAKRIIASEIVDAIDAHEAGEQVDSVARALNVVRAIFADAVPAASPASPGATPVGERTHLVPFTPPGINDRGAPKGADLLTALAENDINADGYAYAALGAETRAELIRLAALLAASPASLAGRRIPADGEYEAALREVEQVLFARLEGAEIDDASAKLDHLLSLAAPASSGPAVTGEMVEAALDASRIEQQGMTVGFDHDEMAKHLTAALSGSGAEAPKQTVSPHLGVERSREISAILDRAFADMRDRSKREALLGDDGWKDLVLRATNAAIGVAQEERYRLSGSGATGGEEDARDAARYRALKPYLFVGEAGEDGEYWGLWCIAKAYRDREEIPAIYARGCTDEENEVVNEGAVEWGPNVDAMVDELASRALASGKGGTDGR